MGLSRRSAMTAADNRRMHQADGGQGAAQAAEETEVTQYKKVGNGGVTS